MKSEQLNHARLCLGLTRKELQRLIEVGEIDLHILNRQLEHYSSEIKLDALTEKWIQLKSLDQVDKFKSNE